MVGDAELLFCECFLLWNEGQGKRLLTLFWGVKWIDFERGVAGLQAMHMLPCGEERTVELLECFEGAVYAALGRVG